jgi:HlyD family secretion protein
MRSKMKWLVVAIVLVVAAAALWTSRGEKPVPVNTVTAKTGSVEQIVSSTSSGTVEPEETANMMSQYPGAITHIYYRQGDSVKKGDVILAMDNALVKVDLDNAREAYDRAKKLFASHAISKAALDTAMYAYQAAQARYDQSLIKAPVSGTITQMNAHLGEFPLGSSAMLPVGASGLQQYGLLVQIMDEKAYHIKAPFDEVDSGMIKNGQEARITFDAFPDRTFKGRVFEVSPAVSTALDLNRTIEAKISLPHINDVRMGMSADVEIIVNTTDNALFVPTYSIQESSSGNNKFVWVIDDHKAKKVYVQTGISNWDNTVITKGLTAGAKVILPSDTYTLQEGMEVSSHD